MSYGHIPREELARRVARARSVTEVLSSLGLNASGGRRAGMRRRIIELGLDTSHFRRGSRITYSPESLAAAVAASTSVYGVLDYLGIARSGGAHTHISRRIKAGGIDTSHFSHPPGTPRALMAEWDERTLAAAVSGAKSMREILRRLGLPDDSTRAREEVRRRLRESGLREPAAYRRVRLDPEAVRAAAAGSRSVADLTRRLQLTVTEANRRRVMRAIARQELDISHFRREVKLPATPRGNAAAMLARRPPGSGRAKGASLRRLLTEIGVPAICVKCHTPEIWQGEPLTLQVDHINGDPLDNRRANLRLLCPNCHSQTATYAGRNRGVTAS